MVPPARPADATAHHRASALSLAPAGPPRRSHARAPHRRGRRPRARPAPTCSPTAAVEAVASIPHRYLRTTRHPAAVAVAGAAVVRRRLRVGGQPRRRLRRHRRRPGRGGRRARRGPVRRARVAAGGRAHGRAAAGRRPGRRRGRARRCRSSTWPGPPSASIPWPRACAWWTASASPVEAAGERGPLLVAQCDTRQVLSDIKLAVDDDEPGDVIVLQRLGPARRVGHHGGVGRPRPGGGARPPHVDLPAAGAPPVGQGGGPLRRAGPHPAGALPLGPGADPPHPHPPPAGGDLRGAGGHRGAAAESRATTPARASTTWRRSWATCCSRWCSTPPSAAEEGRFTLADVARGIHDKLVHRHPHVFAGVRGRHAGRGGDQLGADQAGREGPLQPHGRASARPCRRCCTPTRCSARRRRWAWIRWPATEGLGADLFALVDRCRRAQVDPEAALRATAARFRDRFRAAEATAEERGVPITEVWPG